MPQQFKLYHRKVYVAADEILVVFPAPDSNELVERIRGKTGITISISSARVLGCRFRNKGTSLPYLYRINSEVGVNGIGSQ